MPSASLCPTAVKGLLVQDCAKNPHLRKITRDYFRQQGLVSVSPTEGGITKIDDFHPYNVSSSPSATALFGFVY